MTKEQLKATLNLPKTAFPMRLDKASESRHGVAIEPRPTFNRAERDWYEKNVTQFILHDGPPFANGDIHLGHAINKVVKDITNRFHNLMGRDTLFRPGWDCHGLPIENQVKEAGVDTADPAKFREACAAHAQKWVDEQALQFTRLGVKGVWEDPYITMNGEYECNVVRAFARCVGHGLVYRKKKPVPWSIENQTALAVAELEYQKVNTESVYVGFEQYTTWASNRGTQFLAWTTTPWTLPSNQALAVNKDADYVRVKWNGKMLILAAERAPVVCPGCEVLETFKGQALTGMKYVDLFKKWGGQSLVETMDIYHADFVDTSTGTGIVHIAPSHGADDFKLAEEHDMLVLNVVGEDGRYRDTSYVPDFLHGKLVWDAQKEIIEYLRDKGQVHGTLMVEHDYAHDWRSHKPIITRATDQWFIAMDKPFKVNDYDEPQTLRERAIAALDGVEFVPASGKTRLLGMLKSRPDWCISRQRLWGVPIPAFYDGHGDAMLTQESADEISYVFQTFGSNIWYTNPAHELIKDVFKRPLMKETDTFDVWFESGASWLSMPGMQAVADVYIEGSDQHRGWFQHSLLLSVAVRGKAPFKKVVTHGFVVKPDGTKVSKSDPEYVRATEMMDKIGIDPIRLWIASNDFQKDICASPEMLEKFLPKYNAVRNSLRFLLSNLEGFDPETDAVHPNAQSLDMWILWRTRDLLKNYADAMETFAYHTAVSHLFNFMNVDLSATYANAMKDRLYCALKDAPDRRKTQTTMFYVLMQLLKMLDPIIPHTVAEVRDYIPKKIVPDLNITYDFAGTSFLMRFRDNAIDQLDALKKSVGLNKATDAEIRYIVDQETYELLRPYGEDLADVVGCGCYTFHEYDGKGNRIEIVDRRDVFDACERSWKRRPDVELRPNGLKLSTRDALAVDSI